MNDAPRQTPRKLAIVLATTLFSGFGCAAMLSLNARINDEAAGAMLGIMTAGALIAGVLAISFADRFRPWAGPARFMVMLPIILGLTIAVQAILAGAHFYLSTISLHSGLATFEGWLELVFTTLHGVAYFYIFGLSQFWPALLAAAVLFSFATLTLRRANP